VIRLKEAVVVEGKYDKIKLSSLIDGVIITTEGFGIYKDAEKMALIRHYAAHSGIIILTDSDSAGFRIRNYLKGAVKGRMINVYIPDVFGKERRKTAPSKEGKLGVEGMSTAVLAEAFRRAGITADEIPSDIPADPITKTDLFEAGLSGGKNSSAKRKKMLAYYGLPQLLSAAGMVEVLNTVTDRQGFYETAGKLFSGE